MNLYFSDYNFSSNTAWYYLTLFQYPLYSQLECKWEIFGSGLHHIHFYWSVMLFSYHFKDCQDKEYSPLQNWMLHFLQNQRGVTGHSHEHFIQSDLQYCVHTFEYFFCTGSPWESNPQSWPCSTNSATQDKFSITPEVMVTTPLAGQIH